MYVNKTIFDKFITNEKVKNIVKLNKIKTNEDLKIDYDMMDNQKDVFSKEEVEQYEVVMKQPFVNIIQ